jgi:hypothetical protein
MRSNGGAGEKVWLPRGSLSFRSLDLTAVVSSNPTYKSGDVIVFPQGGCEIHNVIHIVDARLSDLLGGDDVIFNGDTSVVQCNTLTVIQDVE